MNGIAFNDIKRNEFFYLNFANKISSDSFEANFHVGGNNKTQNIAMKGKAHGSNLATDIYCMYRTV